MSNPSGPPGRAGLTPPVGPAPARPGAPAAPGSAAPTNGEDDTIVRSGPDFAAAMRREDDPPTLAQRIMNHRSNGPNGSNGASAANGAQRPAQSAPSAQTAPPAQTPAARAPHPGAAPATYTPLPSSPGSQSTASTAPVQRPESFRKPVARNQGTPGPSRINRAETPPAGASGTVPTGAAARGVPEPAVKTSVSSAAPGSASSASSAPKSDKAVVRRTRKARLRLSRVDPWSVMKTAFMFSIAAGIVLVVAVYSLWTVIQASDLFTAVDQIVQDAIGTQGDTTPFRLDQYINTPKVMGATALIAVVDVVLLTALATLTAFLYNLSASVLGGLEVTLAED